MRTHLSAIRRRAYTNLFTDALLRDLLQALPCISTAIITTILHLNTHHTAIQLFTTYPAPYKNPVDRTTLEISPDLSSNISLGDPLAHLLHNTYHYDHRQFTISPQLQDSPLPHRKFTMSPQLQDAPPPHRGFTTTPQQDDSAHLTALYADLLLPPYIHPTETPSPANPTAHYANLRQLPYLPPMLSPFYLQLPDLLSNDFSSEDLPLRNHSTTIRSPPQSQSHSHLRVLPPNRRTRPRGGPSLPPIRPGIRHSPTIPPIPSHTATILHNTHTRRHHPHCPAIPSYSEPPTAPNLAKRARPSYHTPPVRNPTTRNHPPRHLSMRARHRKNPPTTTSPPPFAPLQPPNSNAFVSHRDVDHNLSHHSRRHPHHDSRLPSTGPHPFPEQIR